MTMQVFDRKALRRRRDRAAANFSEADFLVREVGERVAERLEDLSRKFPVALDLGCHDGSLGRQLGSRGSIRQLIQCDLSPQMAAQAATSGNPAVAVDEEALPFGAETFDLVLSVLALHWVNDLPGCLLQIRHALKPDGMFLGALLGGETLGELRAALLDAEAEIEAGVSPRLSPVVDLRDAGALLQRAGFALPVADADTIRVNYGDPLKLMLDLRAMGQSNAVRDRRKNFTRRETLLRASELYRERHAGPDGRVQATFQVIYLTGWAPHASQQQPLRPGSARLRFAEALDSEERPAGEAADPHRAGDGGT